jgi:predicted metal-binding membrane protein
MSAVARMRPAASSRRALAAAVLAVAGVGWWLSVVRMQGMDAGPSTQLGPVGWFAATWLVMMAAMMFPAIAPVAAAECVPPRSRAQAQRVPIAAAFLAGYLLVWALVGAGAYELLQAGRTVAGGLFEWHRGGHWLAVAILLAAAIYQLTPIKRRSLASCKAPLARLDADPIGHPAQGARAGISAGGRCLASSWALMAVLFALGAMSLVWMAVVAVLIAAERLLPLSSRARIGAAGVLLALTIGVAAAPTSVPGLTVPGSYGADGAMMQMGGGAMAPATGSRQRTPSRSDLRSPAAGMSPR